MPPSALAVSLRRALDGYGISEVERDAMSAAELGGRALQARRIDVPEGEARALGAEPLRDAEADAGGPPGHDRDAARETIGVSHCGTPGSKSCFLPERDGRIARP